MRIAGAFFIAVQLAWTIAAYGYLHDQYDAGISRPDLLFGTFALLASTAFFGCVHVLRMPKRR